MANYIIRNLTAGEIVLGDVGLTIAASGERNLHDRAQAAVARSADLVTQINAGNVVLLDNDGTTPLTQAESLAALQQKFDTRMLIDDLSDVDLTGASAGDLLQITSTNVIAVDPETAIQTVTDFREPVQSGASTGGVISANTATTVDVQAGTGFIIDAYTDPLNVTRTSVSWLVSIGLTVNQPSNVGFTTIAVDNTGTIVQINGDLSNAQERTLVKLGRVYFESSSIQSIFNIPRTIAQTSNNFYDYLKFLGETASKGFSVQKVTSQLSIFRGAGEVFAVGVDWNTTPTDPNTLNLPAVGDASTPAPFDIVIRDGTVTTPSATVIPKTYDDGTATPVSISGKQAVIHYLLENAGGARYLQLGQTVYSDYKKASDALFNDATNFIFFSNAETAGFALLAQIILAADASDFEDATKAGINNILGEGGTANSSGNQTDELVKVSADDQIPDYLSNKISAGTGISLAVLNPGVNEQLEISSAAGGDLAQILASRAIGDGTQSLTAATFNTVSWPTTNFEDDTAVLSHDPVTNNSRITFVEAGNYLVYFSLTLDPPTPTTTFTVRAIKNGVTTAVTGSERSVTEDEEANDCSNVFPFTASAGDYLELQVQPSVAGAVVSETSNFGASRMRGSQGVQGIPGSGSTITVEDEGITVSGGPHSTLNFVGAGVTASNAGGGTATVTIPGTLFGNQFQQIASEGVSSTSSDAYQNKLTLTTSSLPSGTYHIGFYCEIYGGGESEVSQARVELNNSTIATAQTASDTDYDLEDVLSGFKNETLSGINTIDIDWRNPGGGTAFIRRARLEIWRIS